MGRYRSTRWLSTRAALLSPGKSQLSPSITPNPPVDAQSVRCSPSPSRSKSASFRQSNVLYRPSQVAALGYFGAWGVSRSLCFVIRRLWQPTGVTSQRNKTIIISLLFDRLFFVLVKEKKKKKIRRKERKEKIFERIHSWDLSRPATMSNQLVVSGRVLFLGEFTGNYSCSWCLFFFPSV